MVGLLEEKEILLIGCMVSFMGNIIWVAPLPVLAKVFAKKK